MHKEESRVIGQRLRQARRRIGLTQTTMAQAVGISMQQWHKFEKGENRISAVLLYRVAKTTRLPITWFFSVPEAENEGAPDTDYINKMRTIPDADKEQRIYELLDMLLAD